MLQDARPNAPFVPSEGDMKIQLSSTTMAWVDRRGNILHQWKRTKRGTRGGKNRRQEEHQSSSTPPQGPTPRAQTPRDSSKAPSSPTPEAQDQLTKENTIKQAGQTPTAAGAHQTASRQDSDCSSFCELNDEPHRESSQTDSVHTPTAVPSHNRQDSHVSSELVWDTEDFTADQLLMPDPSSTSPHEMAELITRLYGLVNVLQSDNEQVCASQHSCACMNSAVA